MRIDVRRSLVAMTIAVLAAGCDSGTGGRPVTFSLSLAPAGAAGAGRMFRTSAGWEVTLDEACVAVGPVYLWIGTAHLAASVRLRRFAWPKLVRQAHAHPGDSHFNGGEVRGEWAAQQVFRPLDAGAVEIAGLNGLAGPVRSFSLYLDPPRGAIAGDPCLRGHHAYAVGIARRGDVVVPFEGGLDIESTGTKRRVDGVPLEGTLVEDAVVTISMDVAAWFDTAAFETLATRNDAGRFVITRDSTVRDAWFIGARRAGTFSGRLVQPATSQGSP